MFEQIADLSMLDLDDFVSFIVLFERPSAVNVHNPILRPTLSFAVDLGASSGYRLQTVGKNVKFCSLFSFFPWFYLFGLCCMSEYLIVSFCHDINL
ncbi:hypothetical protein V6N13_097209 [Hibiscus sabdariffa]